MAGRVTTRIEKSGASSLPASSRTPLRCEDCGQAFAASEDGSAPRCPQCGSSRCKPTWRTVAGQIRAARSPVEEDRFARLALWGGLITVEQFADCVEEQIEAAAAGEAMPELADLLVARGHIGRDEAEAIRRVMHTRSAEGEHRQFGQIAVRRRFVTEEQLRECLDAQAVRIARAGAAPLLGDLLVERGYMTEAQALTVFKTQARQRLGALHELHNTLSPARARLLGLLRRARRALWGLAIAVGLAAVVLLGGWLHRLVAAPPSFDLICEHCGHQATVQEAGIAAPCKHCGGGEMLTRLRCSKCGVAFPLKLRVSPRGEPWIEPCPKCGSLDHVRLPDSVEPYRNNPRLQPPGAGGREAGATPQAAGGP